MMREEAIVSTLSITKAGERKCFQIKLPHDTRRIIGIEWGMIRSFYAETGNYVDPAWYNFPNGNDLKFQIKPNKLVGEIALQTLGVENIFYRGEMIEADNSFFYADFTLPGLNQFNQITHGRNKFEIDLDVEGNPIVEAYYRDRRGILNTLIARYTLHLYLWIEKSC